MTYLFIDTETTGLPRSRARARSPDEVSDWPRLVQLGWILCADDGERLDEREQIVRPAGFTIDRGAVAVHGITTERALAEGVPLKTVLRELNEAVERSTVLVGHNVDFDRNVLAAEFVRLGMTVHLTALPSRCTMRETTDFCRIPGGPRGYKWPSLGELHELLFDEPPDGAHSALADAEACRRSFFRLRELGVME